VIGRGRPSVAVLGPGAGLKGRLRLRKVSDVAPPKRFSWPFFRTVSFSEPLPIIEGEGVYLRAPQMSDYRRVDDAARGKPSVLDPVGADLAVG
jgi:hypothetical protein